MHQDLNLLTKTISFNRLTSTGIGRGIHDLLWSAYHLVGAHFSAEVDPVGQFLVCIDLQRLK